MVWIETGRARKVASPEMSNESSVLTYVVQEPYETALKLLRRELENEGLRVPAETDVSGTIRAKLGLDLWPCRVLHVCCPLFLLQAAVIDPAETAFLPVRVVISGRERQTVIRLARSTTCPDDSRDRRVAVLASMLLSQVQKIMEKIGAPQIA